MMYFQCASLFEVDGSLRLPLVKGARGMFLKIRVNIYLFIMGYSNQWNIPLTPFTRGREKKRRENIHSNERSDVALNVGLTFLA